MAGRLSLVVMCALLMVGTARAGTEVLELSDGDFQSIVEGADFAVVVFHAPWCHHCHTYLDDIFQPAAAQLQSEDITVATVDIEAAKEVQSKYVIRQVPSVKLFRQGMMFPYEGPTQTGTVAELVQYLESERAKLGLEENPVITLTNENFDDIITTTELIVVKFYTDMCATCQRLEPLFTAAARQLLHNQPPVRFGRVQIPDQMKVAERFPLQDYPLLMMFRFGSQYNYTCPKETTEGIVEYMRRQAGPSSIPLERVSDVKKFINTRDVTVVAYFHDNQDSILLREFLESGNLVRTDMELGHTQKEGVAHGMNQQPDTIVVYHPIHLVSEYETGFSVISSPPANATELRELYLEHAWPLVGEMTQSNYATVYRHRPLLLAYCDVDWSADGFKGTWYWHGIVASVARDFADAGILFAIANEADYHDDLRALGLADWGEDVAVGLFAPGPLKYPLTEEMTADSLTEFLQSYVNGELTPHFNSEPAPKPVKGVLIRKIVGSMYKKEVGNVKKNVMVLLCVPALPECREASEYFLKLATQFRGVTDLVFAEMNVALNDPPLGTSVDPLPSFLFSARGSEEIFPVSPLPKDEADLAFFLKWKQNIKPQRSKGKTGKDEL